MPWRPTADPTTMERVAAGFSYLTGGLAGLGYLLLVKGSKQSRWFRFHAFQSIFLAILVVFLDYLFKLAGSIGDDLLIPMVAAANTALAGSLHHGVDTLLVVLTNACFLVFIYGAVMAFLGKFAEVPLVSNVIRTNMGA